MLLRPLLEPAEDCPLREVADKSPLYRRVSAIIPSTSEAISYGLPKITNQDLLRYFPLLPCITSHHVLSGQPRSPRRSSELHGVSATELGPHHIRAGAIHDMSATDYEVKAEFTVFKI